MNRKLCIFDLDGTLTNTIDTIAYFVNSALGKFGFGSIETEKYKLLVGDGAKTLIQRALDTLGVQDETQENLNKVLAYYNETYNADFLYLTKVYDGIEDLLDKLKAQGVKIAVLSNKPHDTTALVLEAMFKKNTFDLYFGAREGIGLKPSPEGVFEIMETLGAKPEDCFYIGDTKTDMQTGKNAGLFTIGVLWGFRDRQELTEGKADLIVEQPAQIADFVRQSLEKETEIKQG